MLLGNLLAGGLWEVIGPGATFLAGAALTVVALLATLPLLQRRAG